ncbi:MAG: hypothetical protein H6R40_289 [Gemmatimonadetes bacterium]|nr:hypothetical protein [Gemmatimonadota bacterium]
MRQRDLLAGVVAIAAMAGCGGGPPKEVPTATFATPADTLLTRYVNVPAAAWLGGERWAVVAGEFNEAGVADFGAGRLQPVGGRGEAELRNPFGVFSWADTAFVSDWALRRVSRWTSAGQFVGATSSAAALRGAFPVARDAAGRFYFEVKPPSGQDEQARDSAAVVRSDPGMSGFDTLARLSPLDLAEVEDRAGRRFERRVFSGEDHWGVQRDGTVWIARVYQNLILRIAPDGHPAKGPSLPDRVLEVTRTDREHFVLQFPEELQSTADRIPVAAVKPPFEHALGAPNGEIWLEKSRSALDSVRTYQVADSSGVLSHVVILPSRQGRVIALGDTLALVAEQYKEGVRLMQLRIPRPTAASAP